jgi:hypothetical protein
MINVGKKKNCSQTGLDPNYLFWVMEVSYWMNLQSKVLIINIILLKYFSDQCMDGWMDVWDWSILIKIFLGNILLQSQNNWGVIHNKTVIALICYLE